MKKLVIAFLIMATWTGYAVEVVENPARPEKPLGLKLEKTKEFLLEDPKADVFIERPVWFLVGADGDHFVLEDRTYRVFRFGPEGKYLGSFAGKGQGPGQIAMMANTLVHTHDGGLAIPDFPSVIHFYGKDGHFKRDLRLDKRVLFRKIKPGLEQGYFAELHESSKDRTQKWTSIVHLDNQFSGETPVFATGKKHIAMALADRFVMSFVVDKDGNILVSPECRPDYVIQKYDAKGELTQEIHREYEPVERSEKMRATMKDIARIPLETFYPDEDIKVPEPGLYEHAIHRLVVDSEGRIWSLALQSMDDKGKRVYGFDVFSPEGDLVDQLQMNEFELRFFENDMVIYKDNIMVLTRNGEGDPVIQHWRIIEPQGGTE